MGLSASAQPSLCVKRAGSPRVVPLVQGCGRLGYRPHQRQRRSKKGAEFSQDRSTLPVHQPVLGKPWKEGLEGYLLTSPCFSHLYPQQLKSGAHSITAVNKACPSLTPAIPSNVGKPTSRPWLGVQRSFLNQSNLHSQPQLLIKQAHHAWSKHSHLLTVPSINFCSGPSVGTPAQ